MIKTIQDKNIPLSPEPLIIYESDNTSYPYYALYDQSLIGHFKDEPWGSCQVVVKFTKPQTGHVVASNYQSQPIGYYSEGWNSDVFYYITDETKIKFPNIYSLQSI